VKKTPNERCSNCGNWTCFGVAVGEREARKWCRPCWKQYLKNAAANKKRTPIGGTPADVWLRQHGAP
jgi:hypothetical protein